MFIQNCPLVPNKRARRSAVSAEMPRLPAMMTNPVEGHAYHRDSAGVSGAPAQQGAPAGSGATQTKSFGNDRQRWGMSISLEDLKRSLKPHKTTLVLGAGSSVPYVGAAGVGKTTFYSNRIIRGSLHGSTEANSHFSISHG